MVTFLTTPLHLLFISPCCLLFLFPLLDFSFFLFPIPLFQTLETAENADCHLMDRDIMLVIFTLAKAGHQQHLPEMAERLRHERNYIPGIHANIDIAVTTMNSQFYAYCNKTPKQLQYIC